MRQSRGRPEKTTLEKKLAKEDAQLQKDIEGRFILATNDMDAERYPAARMLAEYKAQYRLRDKLKTTGETLPNQLDKEVRKPTLRWIFKIMEGLGIARFEGGSGADGPGSVRELVTNMTPLRLPVHRSVFSLAGSAASIILFV